MSLCFSCHDASTDMQHGQPGPLIRSGHLTWVQSHEILVSGFCVISWNLNLIKLDSDHRSNFQIDLSGSKYRTFDESLCERYDIKKQFPPCFLLQELFAKTLTLLKVNFSCLTCPGKAKMWPKVVKSGMVGFKISQPFCSLLSQSSIVIRGQVNWG